MIGDKASRACAKIVASAIKGTRKFGASEHAACMKGFAELRKAHPEYGDEIDSRIVSIGNRSAFAKDLAKAGLVSEGEASAWAREIEDVMDEVAAEAKAAFEAPTKK